MMWFAIENNPQFLTTSFEIIPAQKLTCAENWNIGHNYTQTFIFFDEKISVKADIVSSKNIGLT